MVFLKDDDEKYCSMVHYNWVDTKLSTAVFPPTAVKKFNMKKTSPAPLWIS